MFQDFENPSDVGAGAERVKRLRALMSARGLDAFIVPRADEHQGEYVPPSAERLRWVTGFTGSAGLAAIARKAACLFVDGRYTIQARAPAVNDIFEVRQVPERKLSEWLIEHLPPGATVGFDPWLHTVTEIERLGEAVAKKNLRLKPVSPNPVDRAWGRERPPPPAAAVVVQPLKF